MMQGGVRSGVTCLRRCRVRGGSCGQHPDVRRGSPAAAACGGACAMDADALPEACPQVGRGCRGCGPRPRFVGWSRTTTVFVRRKKDDGSFVRGRITESPAPLATVSLAGSPDFMLCPYLRGTIRAEEALHFWRSDQPVCAFHHSQNSYGLPTSLLCFCFSFSFLFSLFLKVFRVIFIFIFLIKFDHWKK